MSIKSIVNNNHIYLSNVSECCSPVSTTLLFSLVNNFLVPGTSNNLFNDDNVISNKDMEELLLYSKNSLDFKTENIVIINDKYEVDDNVIETVKKLSKFKYDTFDNIYYKKINKLVSDLTKEIINNLLQNSIERDPFIMLNISYFQASWKNSFKSTTQELFVDFNDQAKLVDMMHNIEVLQYYEDDDIKLCEKKYYDGSNNSMIFVMPKNKNDYNVANLEYHMQKSKNYNVDLKIPKFKQEATMIKDSELTFKITQKMKKNNLKLPYRFYQKCVIEVDEYKTCAAVASGVSYNCYSMSDKNASFHACKPFYYFIYNKKYDIILFSGKYGY
mgnify:CR=1 FL=1